MSEQKTTFMQQLDAWTDRTIIEPLMEEVGGDPRPEIQMEIRKAIRTKVLESYRNGQAAGPAKPRPSFNKVPRKSKDN